MQSEYQTGMGSDTARAIRKIVGDLERSIRQKSSNTMKLKGFWNIAGYCPSMRVGNSIGEERKLFLFWWRGGIGKGKRRATSSCSSCRASKTASVLRAGEMD
jgi:hypothetical protein